MKSKTNRISVQGLRTILRKFDENGRYAKAGAWEIGNGGYDLYWEISHDGIPIIDCVSGTIEVLDDTISNIDQILAIIKSEYP